MAESNIRSVSGDYTKKEFTVTVPKDFDYYKYVILANVSKEAGEYVKQNPPSGQLMEDYLRNLISENKSLWNTTPGSSDFKLIPMYGESDGVKTITQLDNSEIKLYRSLVRVDIKVDQGVPFTLERIYVYNRPSRGRIAPDSAAWSNSQKRYIAPSLPANLGIVDTEGNNNNPYIVSGNRSVQEIYLYETEGKGTQDYVNATCLVLGGQYQGKMSYYRVDFAELTPQSSSPSDPPSGNWWEDGPPSSGTGEGGMVGAGDVYHPLIRNHHYEISITGVRGEGAKDNNSAVRSINTQLASEFLTWDNKNQDVIIDNAPYQLEIKQSKPDISQNAPMEITFTTSYPNPKWTLGEPSADWIECNLDAGKGKITVSLKTSVAIPPSGSEGYFRLNLIGSDGKHKVSQQIKIVYK
ncbi:MAG: hypothetical protein LBI58_06125 [Tannerellaceae bacterium]|nr:hypothetical protein [Tannerellaceae bacterium]